jgi:hypothetical protein
MTDKGDRLSLYGKEVIAKNIATKHKLNSDFFIKLMVKTENNGR